MRKGSSKLVESLHVQSVVHTAIRFYPIPETVALLFRAAGPRMHSSRLSADVTSACDWQNGHEICSRLQASNQKLDKKYHNVSS